MILNKTVPSKEDPFFLFPFKTLFDGDHFLIIYIYIYIYIYILYCLNRYLIQIGIINISSQEKKIKCIFF